MIQLDLFAAESLSLSGEGGAKRQVRVKPEKGAPQWRSFTPLEHRAAYYLSLGAILS